MAGAGTGLPGSRGDVATTLVDQQAYGAGEAAAADGFARAAAGLGKIVQALEPAAAQEAKIVAEQQAAAGEFTRRIEITGADAAFNDAMTAGTMARLGNQRDADLDAMRLAHPFDPDGLQAAISDYRTKALDGAVPDALAITWANEFDDRANRHLSVARNARAEADVREAQGNLVAQTERFVTETVSTFNGQPIEVALADPTVQGNILLITRNIDALEQNPAFGISPEEADAMRQKAITQVKTGAAASYAVGVLRDQGSAAALNVIQEMQTADMGFGSTTERDLVVSAARDAVDRELSLTNQRRNQANAERAAAEQETGRLIEEDVAQFALTGEGTGLTEDQVRAGLGDAGVLRWRQAKAEQAEVRYLYENLPADPDEAAAEIARRASTKGFESLPLIADGGDLSTVAAAIIQVESGGVNGLVSGDPDGAGPAGGGAYGLMQLLPATAQTIAAQLGIPFDANRLRNDPAYNRQIGERYLSNLLTRYNGDTFLAITAYHAGEGNVDGWLKSVGDPRSGAITRDEWLNGIEARGNPRSAEYPRKVLAAMNGGRASAAWDAHRDQQAAALADPARSVQTDFAVRSAREQWQAQPTNVSRGQAYVEANLAAQERAGIPPGRRESLPSSVLVVYAGDLDRFARAGDTAGFQGYADSVIRQFGNAGERVLQDVLEVRGDTRFAAQVAARAAGAGTRGQRPSPQVQAQAQTANRANQMNRAANGTGDVRQMTDAEVLAAAGL